MSPIAADVQRAKAPGNPAHGRSLREGDLPPPSSFFFTLGLALMLARRGLRSGARGLGAAFACLVLGVAAIGAIAGLRASLTQGLAAQGRALLGGDLEIETGALPPSAALRTWFEKRDARTSEVAMLHAMVFAAGGRRILVSLKAVDGAWPLAGHARFAPAMDARKALANQGLARGLAAAPLVFERLGVTQGTMVRLGREHFTLRARLLAAPDQEGHAALFGPPALISLGALRATGLVVPGSLVRYALRVVLPAGGSTAKTEAALARAFPDAGWRVRDASQAAPGLQRFLDRTAVFMTLVALTALLVGGVGVIAGVGAWAEARMPEIATLRALGASSRLVTASLLLQALALSFVAIAIGVAIGAALPWLIVLFFGADLPIPARLGIYPAPLAVAACFGLTTALLCMLWPILRAVRVRPASLFHEGVRRARLPPSRSKRDAVAHASHSNPFVCRVIQTCGDAAFGHHAPAIAATVGLVAVLLGLAVVATGAPRFVFAYAATAMVSLGVFGGAGALLARFAAGLATGVGRRAHAAWLGLGLADLARPDAGTLLMVISVGLGLAALGTVALIEGNLHAAFTEEIPKDAPTFYFIDIQNAELPSFERLMRETSGVEAFATVPMLRARVVAVNGVPMAKVRVSRATRWALNQDLGLTYAVRPPPQNPIVAGRWWPSDYRGPPLLSLGAALAKGWGVKVGDRLTLNVLGRTITLPVTSLREIVWQRLGLNFFLVASPGLLSGAPHTNIATVRTTPGAKVEVLNAVTNALPNVSAIEVGGVIAAVGHVFSRIVTAGLALAALSLATGVLVLGVAIAAEERRRVRQAVILKVLGATRGEIRAAWLARFVALGVVAGVIAAGVAIGASFGVIRFLMGATWVFLPIPLAGTLVAAILLMLLAGFWSTGRALDAKAARWLGRDA